MTRLAILATHPIQYHVPWFQHLVRESGLVVKVFYLWDFGVTEQVDRAGFQRAFKWDVPLLEGYDFEFVPNTSVRPGTDHFGGLRNPGLMGRVEGFKPDAVLLFGYNFASLMEFIWRWNRAAVPLLFRGDSHRLLRENGLKEWLRRKVIATVFRRFAAFLYVGQANREYFELHGVDSSALYFSPHAVDNSRFIAGASAAREAALAWKKELGIPEGHRVVLFAGKFESKKRPQDLLRAFMQAGLQDVTLLLVGSGPLERELQQVAGTHPAIRFAPFQNQSLMPRTYAAADLFVLPSSGSGETWGLAVNEAMCLSLPVIASSHVGCVADLVRHGHNGLVFPAGDVGALAGCLREAFADPERLRRWGRAGSEMIAGYGYRQVTDGLLRALGQTARKVRHDQ